MVRMAARMRASVSELMAVLYAARRWAAVRRVGNAAFRAALQA